MLALSRGGGRGRQPFLYGIVKFGTVSDFALFCLIMDSLCVCVCPSLWVAIPWCGHFSPQLRELPWWELSAIRWIKIEHILRDSFHCSALHVHFLNSNNKAPWSSKTFIPQSDVLEYVPSIIYKVTAKIPRMFQRYRLCLLGLLSLFPYRDSLLQNYPSLLVLILKNDYNKLWWWEAT